jgi:phospholipid transport system substrate-binding protein
MKRLFYIALSVLILTINLNAVSYNSEPKIFITELVEDAIKILSDKNISQENKAKQIEKIALENVDIEALGMYTLGDIRKTLDKKTLNTYKDLFQKYFLKSLTSRLTDYSKNKFLVMEAEQKSSKYTIVRSKILETSSQPEIKIDWRVYTKDPLKPLIRDLVVEGLSLARTQKEEFASIISSNNNDINFLFKKLTEFISK